MRHGRAFAYTPAKTRTAEQLVAYEAQRHFPEPLSGPLSVHVKFCVQAPLRLSKHMKPGDELTHDRKPDLDNFLKTLLDGLNGVAYLDDAQVTYVSASKCYSLEPGTHVTVSWA